MSSQIAAIAEAVKTALNAADFSQDFTARRVYVPLSDQKALSALDVIVVPKARDLSLLSRNAKQGDVQIDIGILKLLPATVNPTIEAGNTAIDPYLQLAEEIVNLFVPGAYGGARWMGTVNAPLYDVDQLKNNKVFQTVITLTFKLF